MATGYYVTLIRDRRLAWLLGPYEEHSEALSNVARARQLAREVDPFSDFDAFGTASRTGDSLREGVLGC